LGNFQALKFTGQQVRNQQPQTNNAMTIDKIRHYMNPIIFNHWATVNDLAILETARIDLRHHMELGLLTGIQYVAEEKLLTMKIGKP
jgi:hypothetical protein